MTEKEWTDRGGHGMVTILQGDCIEVMKTLPEKSVNCCVTSPPYWGLRDYGVDGQLGLEKTPEEYVENIVKVFREVRRVLRDDGTVWLNLGDSYASGGRTEYDPDPKLPSRGGAHRNRSTATNGLKPKDLVGIPWRVAFALQADGWYLRSDIIWEKGNCMPESVQDRPTRCHEYIFLLSKSPHYYYDCDAIKVPASADTHARYSRGRSDTHKHADGGPGGQTIARSFAHMEDKTVVVPDSYKGSVPGRKGGPGQERRSERARGVHPKAADPGQGIKANTSFCEAVRDVVSMRNKRSVWHVNSKGFSEAHFATFPPELIRPCILAGCPIAGTVLDPFGGSGTTGEVSEEEGRNSLLIELNPEYIGMAKRRTQQQGLFCNAGNGKGD